MGHIDKFSNSKNWKWWTADLKTNLIISDFWNNLVSEKKINNSNNKKLYVVFILIIVDNAWKIVINFKNKRLSVREAYLVLKNEFYYTNFMSIVTL